jgi:hypothetical protein
MPGGTTVARCIDGDGTVIAGANCACDPRIQDGFSTAIEAEGVGAVIAGLTTPQ